MVSCFYWNPIYFAWKFVSSISTTYILSNFAEIIRKLLDRTFINNTNYIKCQEPVRYETPCILQKPVVHGRYRDYKSSETIVKHLLRLFLAFRQLFSCIPAAFFLHFRQLSVTLFQYFKITLFLEMFFFNFRKHLKSFFLRHYIQWYLGTRKLFFISIRKRQDFVICNSCN